MAQLTPEKFCRTCLQQNQSADQMFSLSFEMVPTGDEQTHMDALNLAEIYTQCTQLCYNQTDSRSEWICKHCFDKLVDFFKFRKMCIDSYNMFEEMYSTMTKDTMVDYKVEVEVVNVCNEISNYLEPYKEAKHAEQMMTLQENDDITRDSFDEMDSISELDYGMDEEESYTESKTELNILTLEKNGEKSEPTETSSAETKTIEENLSEDVKTDTRLRLRVRESKPRKKKSAADDEKPSENEPLINCDVCSKKFFKKHRYDAHMRKHLGLKQWKCDHCEKAFEKYTSMKSHIAVKHYDEAEGKPEFICDVDGCGKTYSLKESLRVHIQQIHEGKKLKAQANKKMCEQCGKSFTNNHSLLKHSYTHTKVTPHKCHICSKMFATNHKLKEHLMRHDGIKNYVCPTCGLRKTTGHELKVHMRYHSPDVQFPCTLCPVIFTRMANMKRHMRVVHCGVKAFPCPHCERSFGKAETLKHHVMTHTGEKPNVCSVCNKAFIQPIALKTHMKTHNKKNK